MQHFDINLYVGLWYHIAVMPYPDFVPCHEATSSCKLLFNNIVTISDHVKYKSGGSAMTSGIAFARDIKHPSQLIIDYDGWKKETYNVLMTDYNNYAMVGNGDKSKWRLMSRSPFVDYDDVKDFVKIAVEMGYDLNTTKVIGRDYPLSPVFLRDCMTPVRPLW